MATLANLVVRISGNTASLNKAVDKAETRMGKFKKGAGKAFAAVRKAATGLAIAGAAAIIGFATGAIKNFADLGDELDKMSQRTGLSVENLSALKFAAEQSGASLAVYREGRPAHGRHGIQCLAWRQDGHGRP